jgi:hypothetical protein
MMTRKRKTTTLRRTTMAKKSHSRFPRFWKRVCMLRMRAESYKDRKIVARTVRTRTLFDRLMFLDLLNSLRWWSRPLDSLLRRLVMSLQHPRSSASSGAGSAWACPILKASGGVKRRLACLQHALAHAGKLLVETGVGSGGL